MIGSGYCVHRAKVVASCYVAAVTLMFAGAFLYPHGFVHAGLLAVGGTLLGFAHAINRSGVRRHGCARNLWAELRARVAAP